MSRKSRRRLLDFISLVPGAYALIAFVLVRRVLIEGWSMAPALLPGERVLFDRLAYTRDRPRSGDIVLVRHPQSRALTMVKRIEAVPGETIAGRTLARGEYWVTGDNPAESTDSRDFGPVHRRNLLARAWLVYWSVESWRRIS